MEYLCKVCEKFKFPNVQVFVKRSGTCQSCAKVRFNFNLIPKALPSIHGQTAYVKVVALNEKDAENVSGISRRTHYFFRISRVESSRSYVKEMISYHDPGFNEFEKNIGSFLNQYGFELWISPKGERMVFRKEDLHKNSCPVEELTNKHIHDMFILKTFNKGPEVVLETLEL